jgi:hypothetical protein
MLQSYGPLGVLIALLVAGFAWAVVATGRRPDTVWPLAVGIVLVILGTATLLFMMAVADFYGGLGNDASSVWYGGAMVLAGLTLLARRFTWRRHRR